MTDQMPKNKSKTKNDSKSQNKRPLSSPDNSDLAPEKRQTQCDPSPGPTNFLTMAMSQGQGQGAYSPNQKYMNTNMSTPGYVQPSNMSNMTNMNSMNTMSNYQTPPSAYYTPLPAPPQHHTVAHNSPSQQQPQQSTENFQQFVVDKLNSFDKRLGKLDSIETQLSTLSQKLSTMDTRVYSLETSVHETNSRVTDIETSRAFDAQTCDEIKLKQGELDKVLKVERDRISDLKQCYDSLKTIPEEVTDIKARSMRDNLLFFGFVEGRTDEDRRSENCTQMVLDYCQNTLQMEDARTNVKIERAHRLGNRYEINKPRPIVVKFSHYPDKQLVKQKSRELSQANRNAQVGDRAGSQDNERVDRPTGPQIRVSDQFPKVIQDRRKVLVPAMIKAKQAGKTAYLSYDKLYIDRKSYTGETVSTSGFS